MRRERIRARGPRGTHALVQAVRAKVQVLVASTEGLALEMKQLGQILTDLADNVDSHEARITALEKRRK